MAEAGGVRQTKSAQMERETNRLLCWKESGRVRSRTTARGVHVCVCACVLGEGVGGYPRSARVLKSAEGFSGGLGGTRWAAATLEKC